MVGATRGVAKSSLRQAKWGALQQEHPRCLGIAAEKKPEHSFFSGTWRSFVGLELSAHDCLRFDGRTDRKKESKNADGSHLDLDMDFCLLALAYKPWNTGFKTTRRTSNKKG